MRHSLIVLVVLAQLFVSLVDGKEILELQATNFELALSAYKYVAILFFDSSEAGQKLLSLWKEAANGLSPQDFCEECEVAVMDTSQADAEELVYAYSLPIPIVRVFRSGIMADYRGPFDDVEGIRRYLVADSQPSVATLDTPEAMATVLKTIFNTTLVLAFPPHEDAMDEAEEEAWAQFQAAADTLRGHASFFTITSESLKEEIGISKPGIFIVTESSSSSSFKEEDGEEGGGGFSLLPYKGEFQQTAISEWVLKNSMPSMGEISFSSPTGELYATQFFSSQKLKFILFLRPNDLHSSSSSSEGSILENWAKISEIFRQKALFSYVVGSSIPEVTDYFSIDVKSDLPMIVAQEPVKDARFKSGVLASLDRNTLQEFVVGVISGGVKKQLKSEPVPSVSKKANKKTNVVKVVGSNVVEAVSTPHQDVLLAVYAPWCAHSKRLAPTLDVVSKAVQGESRIAILKIDGTVNDLPASWRVKSFPTLLYFPSKDKPYASGVPIPRTFGDSGLSLHEIVNFLVKQSSFDAKTLRIATTEQLGTLLGDEDQLRIEYEAEERWRERNKGRVVYESAVLDYLAGEVVFDGQRWHVLLLICTAIYGVVLTVYAIIFMAPGSKVAASKKLQNKIKALKRVE